MGKIGPEGLPGRERGFPNRPLFPVGSDTIRKILPTITPENISTLTQQQRPEIKSRDGALIDFLNIVYRDYQERERGVGPDSYLDFYAGIIFVDSFLQAQAPKQIPKVVRNEERNDVPELLHHERVTQGEYAVNFRVPESAVEKIAYERIREFARKDEKTNDPNIEVPFGQIILNFASTYPYDDDAFLVGAAAYLTVMEVLWLEEQRQRRLTKQEESAKINTALSLWPSDEQKEIDDLFADVETDVGEQLAGEIYSFFDKQNRPGQQDAA